MIFDIRLISDVAGFFVRMSAFDRADRPS